MKFKDIFFAEKTTKDTGTIELDLLIEILGLLKPLMAEDDIWDFFGKSLISLLSK